MIMCKDMVKFSADLLNLQAKGQKHHNLNSMVAQQYIHSINLCSRNGLISFDNGIEMTKQNHKSRGFFFLNIL